MIDQMTEKQKLANFTLVSASALWAFAAFS